MKSFFMILSAVLIMNFGYAQDESTAEDAWSNELEEMREQLVERQSDMWENDVNNLIIENQEFEQENSYEEENFVRGEEYQEKESSYNEAEYARDDYPEQIRVDESADNFTRSFDEISRSPEVNEIDQVHDDLDKTTL